jgi:two-component system, NtrC family, sensor histidine kinase PilS
MPESNHSWFDPAFSDSLYAYLENTAEFERLWKGFMTARVTLGLVLLALQGTIFAMGQARDSTLVVICGAYFLAAILLRYGFKPKRLGRTLDGLWLASVGLDIVAFGALQFMQGSSINYTPLFALPILLAAVLGSLPLALGSAAGVTLLLLTHAAWLTVTFPSDLAPHFVQSALTGAGSFVIAFLAHQISTRLASEELRARNNQRAAQIQQQVNELVIESMSDGILVVDASGTVQAVNPAARDMLAREGGVVPQAFFDIKSEPGWQSLWQITDQTFFHQQSQQEEITILHTGQAPRHMQVRTRLTPAQGRNGESLCVIFVQDQRELEARLRTEKLASMGRMSAAVAHEIRNPLAAIAQANALLDEDLSDPKLKKLTRMVAQNTQRLDKIVEDVLNVSRVNHRTPIFDSRPLQLNAAVHRICHDWAEQTESTPFLRIHLQAADPLVAFDAEHLRRVLINLLDNARRYASRQSESIQVATYASAARQTLLGVWSDSAPIEASVRRHLFEPFFSSESRSSGLGLFICRELCTGHGAAIGQQRAKKIARGTMVDGNEFFVSLRPGEPERSGNEVTHLQPQVS